MGDWYTKVKAEFILNFVEDNRWKYLVTGLGNTLKITLAAVLLGIVIGTLVAIVRSTWDQNAERMRPGAGKSLLHIGDIICKIYLTVIRGTPVVVQLMIMFYIIFATSRNGVGVAMLAFGVNSGAYVAELIRGGIMAIDKGQLEAGRSLGFDYVQTMRFIIVPQALKNVLPALANEFIVLLKETSVAGYVAVTDLTKGGDIIRGRTFSAFMPLIVVALIYLVMVMFFTWLVGKLERRLRSRQVCDMPGSADDETDQPASMWENLSSGFDETPDAVLHKEILQTAQSLPDWAADVLLLSAVHGCSVREVAIACGITTEAAKKRLQRARVLFRNKMKEGETR